MPQAAAAPPATVTRQVTSETAPVVTVRLTGGTGSEETAPRPRVQFTDETVDNEHLGRKKSKKCCIYHRPRAFDETDSDESDDENTNRRFAPCFPKHVPPAPGGAGNKPGGDID